MGSDDSVSGLRSETDRQYPILKGPKPTEDRIIKDRAITTRKMLVGANNCVESLCGIETCKASN